MNFSISLDFSFEKYIRHILSIIPKNDLLGIKNIFIIDVFSDERCQLDSFGCYLPEEKGMNCNIEICINNLLGKKKIPLYLFNNYPEIAALFLSEVLSHEVGHHVHIFKRHSIKKGYYERFAIRYSKAAYYNYFKSRKNMILLSYKIASWNFIEFDKKSKRKIKNSYNELFQWYKKNIRGIDFP